MSAGVRCLGAWAARSFEASMQPSCRRDYLHSLGMQKSFWIALASAEARRV